MVRCTVSNIILESILYKCILYQLQQMRYKIDFHMEMYPETKIPPSEILYVCYIK